MTQDMGYQQHPEALEAATGARQGAGLGYALWSEGLGSN